jgi:DinB family protein
VSASGVTGMGLKPQEAVALLRRTPAALTALLDGLPDAWLEASEGPDTFSPRDVVGHLIHGEETDWMPRLRIILEHGESVPFTPFDRFAFRTASVGRTTSALLESFARRREENLRALGALDLDEAALARTGTHPGLGRVTLRQLLAAWVVHDLGHVKQIVRAMARQYREAVGPWREYLTILDRP